MIAEQRTIEKSGNLSGSVARMSIDESAMAHIMSILTDLYSDPELACIREYSTNAYDAHIEAGVKRAIEVQTPSALDPFLRIRDHGVGLSIEDIHSIYSQYGASTKRGTNEQVGMLGLGCKSALTYCSQFTITSCQDGTKISVAVSRDEDGGGSMTVVDTRTCEEGDGTEITIPVKRDNGFEAKAKAFFRFWPEGSVLLNGEAPARFEGLRITDSLYVMEQDEHTRNRYGYYQRDTIPGIVVMGNVPYPCEFGAQKLGGRLNGMLVAFVPIGSVTFPPNRESLMDTKRTRETLDQIAGAFLSNKGDAIQEKLDESATPAEAIRHLVRYSTILGASQDGFEYRGQPLPSEWEPPNGAGLMMSDVDRYRKGYASRYRNVPASLWPGTVWVHGFIPGKYTAAHKRKMEAWVDQQGLENDGGERVTRYAMLTGGPPDDLVKAGYVEADHVVAWPEVRKVILDNDSTGTRTWRAARKTGSYDGWFSGNMRTEVAADDLDTSKTLVWIQGNKWAGSSHSSALIAAGYSDLQLICLPGNRIEKFKRDFPSAITPRVALDRKFESWYGGLSDAQKQALTIYDHDDRTYRSEFTFDALRKLDADRIDDPDLAEAVRQTQIRGGVRPLVEQRAKFQKYPQSEGTAWENPLRKYVLYRAEHSGHDHTYTYLNAAYAASQETA